MKIQPVVESLERRLETKLKLVSVNYNQASGSYEMYFRYTTPLISIDGLDDHESEILGKIHQQIPQLRDVTMIHDSWTTGFALTLHGLEETVYLTINSKENPISIDELVKFKTVLEEFNI